MSSAGEILWTPPADARERTRVGRFMTWLESERGLRFDGYHDLHRWSVDDLGGFWSAVWEYFEVRSATPHDGALPDASMPGARWFPGATLNYAEHLLRGARQGGGAIILGRSQTRPPDHLSAEGLAEAVGRARAGLVRLGVGRGDRVVAYMPNITETVVALLATASLGAIWASCSPEFGTRSVTDRFRQIEPKVLLTVDGYRFGERDVDRLGEVDAIRAALPTLEATVALPYLYPGEGRVPGALGWDEFTSEAGPLHFEAVPFDHPLYILYSSGTTGLPKPIVHGHGGILLEHLKSHAFAHDLGPGDRAFFFTTTGWMVWNWLISAPLVGSAMVLYDGNPSSPDLGALWEMAAEAGATFFGGAAPFFLACRKAGLVPGERFDLSALRQVISSGAPLPPEGFRWIYQAVGDVFLSSASGGTDVCTAFVAGSPLLPVRAGEIACSCLGCRVEAYDADGKPVIGAQGELVLTAPMPSMPVGFWGDTDGSRYRAAYFEDFPGVWRHGDWITIDETGSSMITGRSDATLNRGGVRLGTSEFYSVVEAFDEVADSLVVHVEDPGGGLGELFLFVVLAGGASLDDDLTARIAGRLRASLSPRHVPDRVHAVPAVPRTLSGKKLEVPVKRILTGTPAQTAASRGALANPESLGPFETLAAELGGS